MTRASHSPLQVNWCRELLCAGFQPCHDGTFSVSANGNVYEANGDAKVKSGGDNDSVRPCE